ncbi:MAG: VOC family protein [Candidatus Competibacteraceae bacterium]|nr:VOC family protein [Candidatus Competibacteraceae bacterium]MBK7985228.1 VOC family protein [Candidatus Competibacteraceae bacterium]MBK8895696.1 VOC family protein [Candidatus Competibacteraceae bacterium]MBK8962788.1 VOC family protein [Candidatus Competibacteraceae bacterium]
MDDVRLQHGAFCWNELMTTDVASAKQFYGTLFGWTTEDDSNTGVNYTLIKVGGEQVGGIMTLPPDCTGMPPSWGVYVTVNDVDATAGQVEALGGKLLRPPMDIPEVGRFCVLQDPQGAVLCAIQLLKSC